MFDRSLKVRRLVALGTAVAATAIAAPLAAADPAPLFIPHTQTAQPRLGEHLNGSDRTWLSMRERTPQLGEGWSGSDRSWLASGPTGGRTAAPSDGFQWGDAGIGAATATALLLVLAGGAVAIRRRADHLRVGCRGLENECTEPVGSPTADHPFFDHGSDLLDR